MPDMTPSGLRVAIFGSGGVGAYFGARLAKAGHDVTFIARGPHLQAMREIGLTVHSINGDFTLPAVKATDELSAVPAVDVFIIAVKTWQLAEALPRLRVLA